MPMIEGWEVSPDRVEMLEKIVSTDPVGDPVITSKCRLDAENGLLVASNNGFAWRIKMGMNTALMSAGKSKWVRWHDVAGFIPKKPGVLIVQLKIRDKGNQLKLDKKGNPKITKWRLILNQNKNEDKNHFRQRLAGFNQVMMDLWNNNKGEMDPPTSDSRI
jgi:hypothetical protein